MALSLLIGQRHNKPEDDGGIRPLLLSNHCDWIIEKSEELLAHSESPCKLIDQTIAFADGQALTNVSRRPDSAGWQFFFDLGGRIITSPNKEYDEKSDQGDLRELDGWCVVSDQLGSVKRVQE